VVDGWFAAIRGGEASTRTQMLGEIRQWLDAATSQILSTIPRDSLLPPGAPAHGAPAAAAAAAANFLLSHAVDPTAGNRTLLHAAAWSGDADVLAALTRLVPLPSPAGGAAAPPSADDPTLPALFVSPTTGNTLLHAAAQGGGRAAVEWMLEIAAGGGGRRGAAAATSGSEHLGLARAFAVMAGTRNHRGQLPVDCAWERGHRDVAEMFVGNVSTPSLAQQHRF
jgi:hypothetical protein